MSTNREHNVERSFKAELQRGLFFGLIMLLGWTYFVASVITSTFELTYASALDWRLLTVLTSSLIYFGIVVTTRRWGLIMKHSNASTVLWTTGVPSFLLLGIIAMIWSVSLEQSEINMEAYALQVLMAVCALQTPVYLCRYVCKSFMALRAPGFVDKERRNDLWASTMRSSQPTTMEWRNMSPRARFTFVAIHFCSAALWTWLVIYYRYICHSFLGQSSWAMAFLWLFLATEWLRSGWLFLSVWPGWVPGAPPLK